MEALYLILDFIHTLVCVYRAKSIVGCGVRVVWARLANLLCICGVHVEWAQ